MVLIRPGQELNSQSPSTEADALATRPRADQDYTARQQRRHNEGNTIGDCTLIAIGEGQEMHSCASHNITISSLIKLSQIDI